MSVNTFYSLKKQDISNPNDHSLRELGGLCRTYMSVTIIEMYLKDRLSFLIIITQFQDTVREEMNGLIDHKRHIVAKSGKYTFGHAMNMVLFKKI